MKKKRNYDITHKVMRVCAGDYAFLAEISRKADIPMAEALHLVISEQAKREAIVVPREQIPMPTFRVRAQPTIAVNGDKAVFVVKPKGGIINA